MQEKSEKIYEKCAEIKLLIGWEKQYNNSNYQTLNIQQNELI